MENPIHQLSDGVDNGNITTVKELLSRQPSILTGGVLSIDDFLRDAARRDNIEMMKLLVEFGADIHAPEGGGQPPAPEGVIRSAASEGAVNAVRWLLDQGAKINFQMEEFPGESRCMPLTSAIQGGHLEVVKLLVERGANINALWGDYTPLSYAIMYGRKEIESYLRSKGALEPAQLKGSPTPQQGPATILDHIEKHLGKPEALALRQVVAGEPAVAIHVIRQPQQLILVTVGMSDRPLTVPKGAEHYQHAELFMCLPPDWPVGDKRAQTPNHAWPAEWLMNVARYPHDQRTWLGGPSVVIANGEPPEPLAPNTLLTSLLLLAEKNDFGIAQLADGRTVQFYSVYPLYTEERDLEKEKGTEALVELFMKYRVSTLVDVRRVNVARASGYRKRGNGRS